MVWLRVIWLMMIRVYVMVSWVMKRGWSRTMVTMWSKPVKVWSMDLPKKIQDLAWLMLRGAGLR